MVATRAHCKSILFSSFKWLNKERIGCVVKTRHDTNPTQVGLACPLPRGEVIIAKIMGSGNSRFINGLLLLFDTAVVDEFLPIRCFQQNNALVMRLATFI